MESIKRSRTAKRIPSLRERVLPDPGVFGGLLPRAWLGLGAVFAWGVGFRCWVVGVRCCVIGIWGPMSCRLCGGGFCPVRVFLAACFLALGWAWVWCSGVVALVFALGWLSSPLAGFDPASLGFGDQCLTAAPRRPPAHPIAFRLCKTCRSIATIVACVAQWLRRWTL